MSDSELDDAVADLYAVDPAEFVAARKDAATAARKGGNRTLATAIGKLRKPTAVAWMVNLLVRTEPEDVADLFDLGERLRDAQRRSAAVELRELSVARQQSIRALTRRAVELADEHGRAASEDAAREVGQTLGAALADPAIGERVRAGRVVTAESYSGFGPAVLALAPEPEADEPEAEPADTEDPKATEEDSEVVAEEGPDDSEREDHAAALAEAQEHLDEAREDEEAARDAAEDARSEAEQAARALSDVKERLERLRAELHEAEEAETDARRAEKSAAREFRRLERVFADARARTSELQEALEELG